MTLPTLEKIQKRLGSLVADAIAFDGVVYRSSTPEYASASDLISGIGSKLHVQRWNPAGIAVVYASLTPEAAMMETLAHYRYFGIPIEDAMPRMFVAIQVKVSSVLDLRGPESVRRLGVSKRVLLTTDWRWELLTGLLSISQMIGSAAFNLGVEGLLVPSVAERKGTNLLLFPENLLKDSKVSVLGLSK